MAEPKKSVQEFAQAIKAKYPQYKDIDDYTLAKKVVAKYPQYADAVEFDEKKKASGEPSEESASAPQSTLPKTLAETRPSVAPIQEVEEVDEFAKNVVDRKAEAKKANFETSGSIATPKAPAAGPVLQSNTVAALSQYAKENKDKKFTPQETEVLERAFKNSAELIDKDLRDARMEPFREERVKRFQNTFDNTFGIGVPVYAGASLIRPYVSDDVKDMVDDVRTAYRRNIGLTEESDNRTWLDDFKQGSYEDGAKKLGLDVADAIGMSAAIAATATPQPGMLTASAPAASSLGRMVYENVKKNVQANPVGAVSMALQGALDKAEELEDNVYMTEAQKTAAITAAGATSVLTESLFSTGDQIIEPYKGMAKNTFKEVVKDWGKASLKAGGEESLESNIEIVGNALTDAAINGTVPKVNPDDLIMATVTSFIAPQLNIAQSYSPAALSTGLQAMRGPTAKQENIETFNNEVQNLKKIKQELKRTDLPESERKALQAAKSRHENNIKAARNEFIQFTETFSEEDQNEVINIMNRVGHLDDEFKKTKSQVLRDEMAAEAADLLSRKAAIEDKYKQQQDAVQEQAADEGVLRAEEPQVGLQEVGQGDQEPQVAAQEGQAEEVAAGEGTVDNTIAADYLLTGGYNTVISTDYLLKGIAGVFSRAGGAIDNIRNKYARELADKNLVDIKNFVSSETYNNIVSEIRDAINSAYGNNQEVQGLLDEVLASPTGMPQRVGFSIESRLNDIDSRIGTTQEVQPAAAVETPAVDVTIESPFDEFGEPDYDAEDAVREIAKQRDLGITSDRELATVARDANGNVIGGAFTSYDNNTGEYTFDVVVSEDAEGKGVGSKLLDAVKDLPGDVQDMNPDAKVKVDVVNPNMQKMLEKRGFVVTEKTGEDRVTMEPSSQVKEQKPAKPTTKKAPAQKVKKTQEELDLETQEQQLRALEDDIQIEKDNFVERKAEIAEQIKEAKASKLSAPEKAELVASLRAELEDAKNESNAIIGQYREEAKALKKDVGKAKVKLQKKVQQKAPKAVVEPVAPASPPSPVSLTAKDLLFLSDDNPRSSQTIFSNILNKILYSDKFKSDRSRLAFVRKYVDPGFTYSVENKRVPMSERLGYLLSDEAFDISKDDYQAFESAVANLGIDIDAVANDVTASLVENSGLGDYVDRVTAKKIAAQQQAADATVAPAMEAPAVQPFSRPGVYSPAYIKTKLSEAYKKLPTKKFVELFNKHVDSGLTEDIAKTSIGRDGYVNLFNSDDYVKFFKDAGIELAKEEAPEKKAEPGRTELEIARDAHERAKRDFLRKSGLASGAQLQALPEFIRLLRSYVRLGIATAKEAYARYKQEFPAVNISEDRFNSVFESAKRLEEKKKIREEASAESLAKRNAKMQERKARTEEAARKAKEDKAERDKVKQEEKEQKKLIDSAMDGYINAILESGDAKTIAAAFKNFQEVAGKLDKTEFVQQLRRTIAKLKEDKHISTVSAGNLNRILRTIERVSPATYALEVDRAMNAVKKEINTQLRKQLNTNRKKALKNIQSGRIGNSTIKPLFQRVLSIDASMIPDESFDDYIAIVTRLGAKQAVLPLADRRAMETTLNNILNNIDAEAGRLIELGEMYNDFVSSRNLGDTPYSEVINQMKGEGLITEDEVKMMKRYKSIILSEAKVAKAGKRAESPEARAALEEELSNIDINVRALENRDDRAIATAIQDNLDAASEMTSQDLRKLLLVIDNINNGFLPHMGEVVRRKLVSINDGKKLASALNKVSLPLGEKIIVNVKGALMRLMGRKSTETGTVRLAAERNPAAFIDEVFGNFKTTPIYDTLIRPMASAFSRFQRDFDVAVNKLNAAEDKLYKSKKSDNEFRSSMYKIQMYLIQREYETNVGNPEVRPAVEWIKATIDAIEEGKLYNEATAAELREQLTKFSEDGEVSIEKIEKSLTPAEKGLIKAIDEVNGSIRDKAVHVSDVIRGEGIEARDNYVHIQVFNDGNNNPLKEIDAFTERYTASTKAKSLITRTGKVNPINLDPYQTAVRGLKMTLLDYHMTPAIKQVNGTLAASKDMVNQRQNLTAVESLMQGFNEGVLANAVGSSMSPDITDTLVTNGYRAVLASVRRAIAETASNITFAISNPAQFTAGVKSYYKLDSDVSFGDVMRNSNSVHTTRLAGGETLTSPQVEKSGFRNTGGVKTEMQPDVINKMARISKLGRRYTKSVGALADLLMSTPDAMVSRPIWLGAYENKFKELTGKEPDLKKISDNDEAYMEANRDAIKKASKEADKQVTQAAASNSPYETIAKLRVNEKDTSSKKIYKAVNGFISRFAIFEFNTARRAIYAMIGNGSISRKEGAALLTGVAMRSIVYVMASGYIGGVMSALAQSLLAKLDIGGFDEEEEEEDLMDAILPNADTPFKFYRSLGGALANILINRNFGNVVKNINGLLVETANEEYGQFLRNGENYDPYENNILMNQLSSLMSEGSSDEKIANFVAAFSGPLSPVARTFIRTFTLTNRAINNKTAASRKKNLDELTNRIPLELAGNLGLIPVYNDVRKLSTDILFDDVKKLEEVKSEAAKLRRQYPNKGDKYDKALDALVDKYVERTKRKRQKREE